MGRALLVCRKDLKIFFVSSWFYWVLVSFSCLSAFIFFNLFGSFNSVLNDYLAMPVKNPLQAPNLNSGLVEPYYQSILVLMIFLIPFISMRSFTREKYQKTIDLLLLSPLTSFEFYLGKFLAYSLISIIFIIIASLFPFLLCVIASPEVLPILTGFLGMCLAVIAMQSIGILVSALSKEEVMAGMVTLIVLFIFYIIHSPAQGLGDSTTSILRSLSLMWQTNEFVQGVVSLKSLVYFLSIIVLSSIFTCSYLKKEYFVGRS